MVFRSLNTPKFRTKHLITVFSIASLFLVAIPVSCLAAPQTQSRDDKNKAIALSKKPLLKGIDYDSPPASDEANCSIEPSDKIFGGRGFVVRNPAGQIVRLYTKEQSGSIHWTFFKNGNEVYREIDSNGDKRVDQYRWFGEAGSRWGVDKNQDGVIDSWKSISAEEVASEVFQAFQTQDRARFMRLCLSNDDLAKLKLGREAQTIVANSVSETLKQIPNSLNSRLIKNSDEFIDFSGASPSVVPAGKMGLQQDLTIYDNTSVLFSSGEEIGNLSLGTLIKVDDAWRIVELPELIKPDEGVQNGRMFVLQVDTPVQGAPENSEVADLIAQFTKLDEQLRNETQRSSKARLYQQRSELILKIAAASTSENDKKLWVRMCATEASIGYQTDEYPGGLKVLSDLGKADIAANERDFVIWELIQAKASDTRKGSRAEMDEANENYLEMLRQYAKDFPTSENTSQALLQLAMFEEFSSSRDSEDNAMKWYQQAAKSFPDTRDGRFAEGANRRLSCYGERLSISGTTLTGKQLDTANFRGDKFVVVHYWSTEDELSLSDFERLIALRSKYKEVAIVGVNLDEDASFAKNFLRQKQPNADWPHLWSEGGKQNSSLALELGVTTVPLTILIDKEGNVAENRAIADELDRQIQRLRNRKD